MLRALNRFGTLRPLAKRLWYGFRFTQPAGEPSSGRRPRLVMAAGFATAAFLETGYGTPPGNTAWIASSRPAPTGNVITVSPLAGLRKLEKETERQRILLRPEITLLWEATATLEQP